MKRFFSFTAAILFACASANAAIPRVAPSAPVRELSREIEEFHAKDLPEKFRASESSLPICRSEIKKTHSPAAGELWVLSHTRCENISVQNGRPREEGGFEGGYSLYRFNKTSKKWILSSAVADPKSSRNAPVWQLRARRAFAKELKAGPTASERARAKAEFERKVSTALNPPPPR